MVYRLYVCAGHCERRWFREGWRPLSSDGRICGIVDFAHNRLSFEKLFDAAFQEYTAYRRIITVFGCPGGKALNRRLGAWNHCRAFFGRGDPYDGRSGVWKIRKAFVKKSVNTWI